MIISWKKSVIGLIVLAVIGVVLSLLGNGVPLVGAATSFTVSIGPKDTYKNFTFFSATTTTATSTNTTDGGGYFVIAGAKKVTAYFTHGGTATTSTGGQIFTIQGSKDGTTWANLGKIIGADVSSTATSSVSITAATSTFVGSMNLVNDTFYAVRCISTEISAPLGVDGEATCTASAEF